MTAVFQLVFALVITIVIEGVVIFAIFRKGNILYYSLLNNVLTNPALNVIVSVLCQLIGNEFYMPILMFFEVVVVFIEGFVYCYLCRWKLSKALLISLLLNSISLSLGFVIL